MRTQVALILVVASAAFAADSTNSTDLFEKKIRPVLAEHCYACRSAPAKNPAGGLRLDMPESTRTVVTPGEPAKSLLITAIRREGKLKMPPSGPLTADQVADLKSGSEAVRLTRVRTLRRLKTCAADVPLCGSRVRLTGVALATD